MFTVDNKHTFHSFNKIGYNCLMNYTEYPMTIKKIQSMYIT